MLHSIAAGLHFPAVIDPRLSRVHGFLVQLQQSQWFKPEQLRQLQALQLAERLRHAARASGHHAPLLAGQDGRADTAFDVLARLPVLGRRDFQQHAAALYCEVGPEHGRVSEKRTTGSTGQPVTVRCTAAAFALREALTLRSYQWFQVDLSLGFAAIRSGVAPGQDDGMHLPDWGGVLAKLFRTGPSHALDLAYPVEHQWAWLGRCRPAYLLTYPSNLQLLLDQSAQPWPGLRAVMSLGEGVSAELRERLRQRWGVPLLDQYSSEELGSIATQCDHGTYHTMAESLHVEVLRDDGSPCEPGETGRVVVTDLYNFATAMLRYELHDQAVLAPPCACGRGLPGLSAIVGRTRNRLLMPDGRWVWPNTGLRHYEALPIRQFQLVQQTAQQLVLSLHLDQPLQPPQEQALRAHVQHSLGHAFELEIRVFDHPLPKGPNGKFEQFLSLLT